MGDRQRPIVGVNFGKLGFLADLLPEQLVDSLPGLCAGRYRVVHHLMFECQVRRGEEVLHRRLGLNECCLLAGSPFTILQVELYVDAEWVTTYSCDGLIVSTPVGSTAHNLSAGGPILRKNLQAFVISPISPHTLTNRPVVDTAEHVYEMVTPAPNDATSVVVDGQVVCQLSAGDRVRVSRTAPSFQLVEVPGHSYYKTLRDKLGWGGKLRDNDK